MNQKSSAPPGWVPADKLVRDIRSATRKHHSAEDQISIVLEGLGIVRFVVHPFLGSDSSRSWRKNLRAGQLGLPQNSRPLSEIAVSIFTSCFSEIGKTSLFIR